MIRNGMPSRSALRKFWMRAERLAVQVVRVDSGVPADRLEEQIVEPPTTLVPATAVDQVRPTLALARVRKANSADHPAVLVGPVDSMRSRVRRCKHCARPLKPKPLPVS